MSDKKAPASAGEMPSKQQNSYLFEGGRTGRNPLQKREREKEINEKMDHKGSAESLRPYACIIKHDFDEIMNKDRIF